ncbi:MAG: hypothetical protein IJY08_03895 [Clostridia bacterium]|nr:hypothetical protein [Clostridia bacterium]
MKKFLAILLTFCMCAAVLVACNEDTNLPDQTDAQTEKQTDAPGTDAPNTDAPGTDAPGTDAPGTEAPDTDAPGTGEDDKPTQTLIEIGSVEAWNELAAAGDPDGKDFEGKTVKLTSNLNFASTSAITLFDTFKGTFDGSGFTIGGTSVVKLNKKNGATIAGSALIAEELIGATVKNVSITGFTIIPPADMNTENCGVVAQKVTGTTASTIEGVTVRNVKVDTEFMMSNKADVGAIVGLVSLSSVNVKNCKITDFTVVTSGGKMNVHGVAGVVGFLSATGMSTFENIEAKLDLAGRNGAVGGVIGWMNASDNQSGFKINKVTVTGIVSAPGNSGGSAAVGGILGQLRDTSAAGPCEVKNTVVDAKVFCTANSGHAGGIAGKFGKDNGQTGGTLTIENCYVAGEVSCVKGGSNKNRTSALLGEFGCADGALTVKNVIIAVALEQTSVDSDATIVPDVTVTNTSWSNNQLVVRHMNGKVKNEAGESVAIVPTLSNIWITITKSTRDATGAAIKDDTTGALVPTDITHTEAFTVIAKADIASKITYDANGFIESIAAPTAA